MELSTTHRNGDSKQLSLVSRNLDRRSQKSITQQKDQSRPQLHTFNLPLEMRSSLLMTSVQQLNSNHMYKIIVVVVKSGMRSHCITLGPSALFCQAVVFPLAEWVLRGTLNYGRWVPYFELSHTPPLTAHERPILRPSLP